MITWLIGPLLLDAVVLGLLVRWVARYNATADLFNMVVVIGGSLVGGIFIQLWLAESIGSFTLLVHAVLLMVLLIKFSGTNPVQAGVITVLFFAVSVALRLAWQWLVGSAIGEG